MSRCQNPFGYSARHLNSTSPYGQDPLANGACSTSGKDGKNVQCLIFLKLDPYHPRTTIKSFDFVIPLRSGASVKHHPLNSVLSVNSV